jgi:hypothetical protein
MPNIQKSRTLQNATTSLSGAQVLATAKNFFGRQNGIYAAFVEQEGPTHVTLRGQGGEEIVVGVATEGGNTSVNASSYMFDQQVAMFLAALPPVVSPGAA